MVPEVIVDPRTARLGAFLREHRDDIVEEWTAAARELPRAQELDRPALVDSLPDLLDCIARIAETGWGVSALEDLAARHARLRLAASFDLEEVVAEYALVRRFVLQRWIEQGGGDAASITLVNQIIDDAVAKSTNEYVEQRNRTLTSLDRIARAAVDSRSGKELLDRLLHAFLQSTPAADTAVVLLLEDDVLRVRGAAGLEESLLDGFSLRMGEGFAGKVAASMRPVMVRSAATDALVKSEVIRRLGVRALYGVPLVGDGRLLGVAHMGSLTAFEFSEDDRRLFETMADRASASLLQHMLREEAHEAVRGRDEMLAIVSHDLRNPLGVVALNAALVSRDAAVETESGKRSRRRADSILRASDRMNRLINDLLDLTSIERGRLAVERKPERPEAIVDEVLANFQAVAAERGVTLTGEVTPDLPAVCCDRDRMLQVIGNLLSNALKATSAGGSVVVRASPTPDRAVRFAIADTGAGIAPEDLTRVFERFWRGKRVNYQGSGRGLAIAKGIVEAHGGRIWAESCVGQGSTFFVEIPAV